MTRIFAKTKHFPKHFSAHIQLKLVDVVEKYYHHIIINFITAHDHYDILSLVACLGSYPSLTNEQITSLI